MPEVVTTDQPAPSYVNESLKSYRYVSFVILPFIPSMSFVL